ncbi:hypothetical protein [Lishizhenia sp.]|uniref:hypothetical protein n=1 Tax=Lishizhenia sp. TaxID=2497594 RepID=UPI00299EF73C|nr:hypothetical protein [Lishizhenia sp.]MDX1444771.1 hypothetical protein [Lishizhenia sp.]
MKFISPLVYSTSALSKVLSVLTLILLSSACTKEIDVESTITKEVISPYAKDWEIIYLPDSLPNTHHKIHAPIVLENILMYVYEDNFNQQANLYFVDKEFNPAKINSDIQLSYWQYAAGVLKHDGLYYVYGNFEFKDIQNGNNYKNLLIYNPINKTITGASLPHNRNIKELTEMNGEVVILATNSSGQILVDYLNPNITPNGEFPNSQPGSQIRKVTEHNANFFVIDINYELMQVDFSNQANHSWNTLNFNGTNKFYQFIKYKDKILASGSFNDGAFRLAEIDYENNQLIPIGNNSNKIGFNSLTYPGDGRPKYEVYDDVILFSSYTLEETISGVSSSYGKYIEFDGNSFHVYTGNPNFNYVIKWEDTYLGFGQQIRIAKRK